MSSHILLPTDGSALAAPLRPSRSWQAIVAPYARASHRHAVVQLLNTGLPFLLLMAALVMARETIRG